MKFKNELFGPSRIRKNEILTILLYFVPKPLEIFNFGPNKGTLSNCALFEGFSRKMLVLIDLTSYNDFTSASYNKLLLILEI